MSVINIELLKDALTDINSARDKIFRGGLQGAFYQLEKVRSHVEECINMLESLRDEDKINEKKYTLADFVKSRVDDETLDRIALKADVLQRENLSKEDKAAADKAAKQEAHAIQPEEKKKSRYSLDFNEIDAKLAECTTVDEVNKYADELLAKKLTVNQRAAIKEKIYDRRRAIIILENM